MSEKDRKQYAKMKADPVQYAAYIARKKEQRRIAQATRGTETKRKAVWRAKNPEKARRIRAANHAVERGIRTGLLVRPDKCSDCGIPCKPEAHHHKGYERADWLDVIWVCSTCHAKHDKRSERRSH